MCGCFALFSNVNIIQRAAKVVNPITDYSPSYHILPGQPILTIKQTKGQNESTSMFWGFIPAWAKSSDYKKKLINARGETLDNKPSFVDAAKHYRCLIPANGFYEWRSTDKQPFYIHLRDRELFFFAGIYSVLATAKDSRTATCAIVTVEPNELLRTLHHRMPLILMEEHLELWLDLNLPANLAVQRLSKIITHSEFLAYPVSKDINNKQINHPDLIKPIEEAPTLF